MSNIGLAQRRITLLTDYGTRDGFAAAMRGVIASIAPDAIVEDATHDIPPGDILAGAWALCTYSMMFPPGTIHVAIVDPAAGSGQRALAARAGGQIYLAPDNGLLSRVLETDSEIVEVQDRAYRRDPVSATFHGRDVFAPAAAHIARGVGIDQLGPRAVGVVRLDLPQPVRTDNDIIGEIVHIDRFGNLITNIPASWTSDLDESAVHVSVGDIVASMGKTYATVPSGSALVYIGSERVLEIAVRDGNAAAEMGVERGARVILHHRGAAPDQ
ncbi:MAG: SAM-dependent chlorinase/fluorinase [Longimicrobiales bacterium]